MSSCLWNLGFFSERCTEKLPLRVDFIHRVEFGLPLGTLVFFYFKIFSKLLQSLSEFLFGGDFQLTEDGTTEFYLQRDSSRRHSSHLSGCYWTLQKQQPQ